MERRVRRRVRLDERLRMRVRRAVLRSADAVGGGERAWGRFGLGRLERRGTYAEGLRLRSIAGPALADARRRASVFSLASRASTGDVGHARVRGRRHG